MNPFKQALKKVIRIDSIISLIAFLFLYDENATISILVFIIIVVREIGATYDTYTDINNSIDKIIDKLPEQWHQDNTKDK